MTESEQKEQKLNAIRDLIMSAEKTIVGAKRMLNELLGKKTKGHKDFDTQSLHNYASGEDRVVEGVFTWEMMLGADRNMYPVPANYASKSKIVQGSKLKAIVAPSGKITYKIIEEIPFDTKIAILVKENSKFQAVVDGQSYAVLNAAISYIGAKVGDRVIIRIPQGKQATFAAVESMAPDEAGG